MAATKKQTPQKDSKGCGIIFGLLWAAFSSIFLVMGINLITKAIDHGSWEEVSCSVKAFTVSAKRSASPPFQPKVIYTYEWKGKQHEGTKVWPSKKGEVVYEDLAKLLEQLKAGEIKQCYVNPKEPREAVLIIPPGEIWIGVGAVIFSGVFVLIGLAIVFFSIIDSQKEAITAKVKPRKKSSKFPIICYSIFGIIGVIILFVMLKAGERSRDAKNWVETPARVIWSQVKSHDNDDGTTYSVDIFYRYEYNNTTYQSNTVGLFSSSSSGRASKQAKVDAHPRGKKITCYVNPEKPWQALLNRELGWVKLVILFPLIFIGIGIFGLFATLRKSGGKKPVYGKLIMKPGKKRVFWLLGSIGIAAFWNGIVSIFFMEIWNGWKADSPDWFGTLFLIPFVLIGLALALHIIYRLIALFNPAPQVILPSHKITIGKTTTIKWSVPSGEHRMQSFSICLVGTESAQYRQGKNTKTDISTFYEHVIIDTKDPRKSSHGSAEIHLAEDALNIVPSWKGDHNSIIWSIHVKGEISLWPDVSDSYDVTISPSESLTQV